MTCSLCILKIKTNLYYECEDFTVLDCMSCKVPMYVWKVHSMFPTVIQQRIMYDDAKKRFPNKRIDLARRKIPEHFHFHMR